MRSLLLITVALAAGLAACQLDPARSALTPPTARLDLHVPGATGVRGLLPPGFVEVRREIVQAIKEPQGCLLTGHNGTTPDAAASYVIEQNIGTCQMLIAYGHTTRHDAPVGDSMHIVADSILHAAPPSPTTNHGSLIPLLSQATYRYEVGYYIIGTYNKAAYTVTTIKWHYNGTTAPDATQYDTSYSRALDDWTTPTLTSDLQNDPSYYSWTGWGQGTTSNTSNPDAQTWCPYVGNTNVVTRAIVYADATGYGSGTSSQDAEGACAGQLQAYSGP